MTKFALEDLKKLVADFQTTRLDDDQTKMIGFEGQGRAVLYAQLAEAYRIGKLLLTKRLTHKEAA